MLLNLRAVRYTSRCAQLGEKMELAVQAIDIL